LLTFAAALAKLESTDLESTLYYERAIAEGSRSRLIYDILCRAYIEQNRYDIKTYQHFEATLQLNPRTQWGAYGVAAYFFTLDEPQNAFHFALTHLRNNSQHQDGKLLGGRCLARTFTRDLLDSF